MKTKKADITRLRQIADQLRIDVVKMIACSGQGHAGGATSMAEILAVLYFHEMNVQPGNPDYPDRDRFVLSKGHGCAVMYATFAAMDYIPRDLLWTLHDIDSPLQMHPELGLCPGVEMSTGSLGQGLSAGIGMALGAKLLNKPSRVYVLIGDGECHEGQIWEAAMLAPNYKLDNLVAIIDYNKFSLSDRINQVMPLEPLRDKWAAFGWNVLEVNGHAIGELIEAFAQARQIKDKPTFIIAHTIKGYGIPNLADTVGSHSIMLPKEQAIKTLLAMGCSQQEIAELNLCGKEK